jgi:hypothetical protein
MVEVLVNYKEYDFHFLVVVFLLSYLFAILSILGDSSAMHAVWSLFNRVVFEEHVFDIDSGTAYCDWDLRFP